MVNLDAPQSSPEPPKSSQKEPGRAPKRLQNHFGIEKADFSKMLLFKRKINIFNGGGVGLGAPKPPPEAPRREKNDIDGARTHPRPSSAAKGKQTGPKRIPK